MIWRHNSILHPKSCIIRRWEVHSEAVSEHFPIYLGLGVYGHGHGLASFFPLTLEFECKWLT